MFHCFRLEAEVLAKEQRYADALRSLNQAVQYLPDNSPEYRLQLMELRMKLLVHLHDEANALLVLEEYSSLWRDFFKERQSKHIDEMQARLGLGLERQKSSILQRENELQQQSIQMIDAANKLKNWLIFAAALVTVLLVFVIVSLRLKNREINKLHGYIRNRVLQRFLPPQIVAEVMSGRSQLDDHPHSQLITVLFVDLVGFTNATDTMHSDKVARVLNDFMAGMTDVIFATEGTIDKFIGDAIMVIFGAPSPMEAPEQARKALLCAQNMQKELTKLNDKWRESENCEFQMRVGIHQGPAIVGSFGSEKRSDYTVIGRTVNIASRIENRAAPGEILFSKALADQLNEPVASKGIYELRGIEEPMQLFALASDREKACA